MYKLLIVDDEPLACVAVQSLLDWASLNIEVIGTAANGARAEEIMSRNMPDIVIADIKMPVKNGLRLAADSYGRNGRLPVFIMLTSFEDFDYARQALKAQAVDYLIKMELDGEKLELAVRNAIAVVKRYRGSQSGDEGTERGGIQVLRENFCTRLLNGLFDGGEDLEAQIRKLDMNLTGNAFIAASCSISLPESEERASDRAISLFNNAIRLARETLTRNTKCYVTPLDMECFTVIFCFDEKSGAEDEAKSALHRTAAALMDYLGIQMYPSVGSRADSLAEIAESYRIARQGGEPHRQNFNERVVEDVKNYIRANLGKRLSLLEVADVFKFNPNYLSRLFSKTSGVGFVEYITGERISAAKKLLTQNELRIYEISEQLGFENSFYFSKVFKKSEGLSPREYANKNK